MAAALGVQSEKNRQRDFEHGSPRQFVVVAIIATLVFIVLVYAAVKIVLKVAGV